MITEELFAIIDKLESQNKQMLEALVGWNKVIKNSLPWQTYEVSVWEVINNKYIKTRELIEQITNKKMEDIEANGYDGAGNPIKYGFR
jgi:hypothetical protein